MNVGFDIHGVLDKYSHVLRPIVTQISAPMISFYVLTGIKRVDALDQLRNLGFLDKQRSSIPIFSISDYLVSHNLSTWTDDKGLWAKDEDWWPSKGIFCLHNRIDYMFDDSERYAEFMPPSTKFFLIKSIKDLINGLDEILTLR